MEKLSNEEKERIREEIWGKKKILSDGTTFYTKGEEDSTLLPDAEEGIDDIKRDMSESDVTTLPENLEIDARRLEELHNKRLWHKTQQDVKEELVMITKQYRDLIYGIESVEDIILEAVKNWSSYREQKTGLKKRYEYLKYYAALTPEQFEKEQHELLYVK